MEFNPKSVHLWLYPVRSDIFLLWYYFSFVSYNWLSSLPVSPWRRWPLTFELGVGDAAPLPAPVAQARALHQVAQGVVVLVPLVAHAVHGAVVGGAHLLVGCGGDVISIRIQFKVEFEMQ